MATDGWWYVESLHDRATTVHARCPGILGDDGNPTPGQWILLAFLDVPIGLMWASTVALISAPTVRRLDEILMLTQGTWLLSLVMYLWGAVIPELKSGEKFCEHQIGSRPAGEVAITWCLCTMVMLHSFLHWNKKPWAHAKIRAVAGIAMLVAAPVGVSVAKVELGFYTTTQTLVAAVIGFSVGVIHTVFVHAVVLPCVLRSRLRKSGTRLQ